MFGIDHAAGSPERFLYTFFCRVKEVKKDFLPPMECLHFRNHIAVEVKKEDEKIMNRSDSVKDSLRSWDGAQKFCCHLGEMGS